MPEFKKEKKDGCVPKGDFFSKIQDSSSRIVVKEATLKAPVTPEQMVETVNKISPSAKMCVGEKQMLFEIALGRIEVDNNRLNIRCTGLSEKDLIIVANGVFLTEKDWIIVRNGVF